MESPNNPLIDKLKTLPQYVIPQHGLSQLVYRLTRWHIPLKNPVIRWFIRHYGVDMSIAEAAEPDYYACFNDFFTRALRAGVRPIDGDPEVIVSPVDGKISQLGTIAGDRIFQAKGHDYTLADLLAGQDTLVEAFRYGAFMTIYLSPRDYHRIHMPLLGKLTRMIYVPGKLFAVNPHTARTVPNLFARNERVITLFDTVIGPVALILVGAINVGSMETVWEGLITPAKQRRITLWDYDGSLTLSKGAEMGRFNMGSTVIVLTRQDTVKWLDGMLPGISLRMGQRIGMLQSS